MQKSMGGASQTVTCMIEEVHDSESKEDKVESVSETPRVMIRPPAKKTAWYWTK